MIDSEKCYGLTIKYLHDENASNPRRDFDQFGHMVCFHRGYDLGDEHHYSADELKKKIESGECIFLPLYLYDHSGITIRTRPFSDPWDSGQIGYIFVSKEEVKKEYGVKRIAHATLKKVYQSLEFEVEEYDAYINGEVYGFVIETEDGEELDSCWGFFCSNKESEKHLMSEARSAAQYAANELSKVTAEQFAIDNEPSFAA